MTDDNRDGASSDVDKVGYKSPPKHSRFKPGQSGNPGGRPRKPKIYTVDDARKSFLHHVLKRVKLHLHGELIDMSLIEAVMNQAITQAVKGDKKMIVFVLNEFFSHANAFEEAQLKQMDVYLDAKDIYLKRIHKILDSKDDWSDEDAERINFLGVMLDVYEDRLKDNMDGSRKKKIIP